MISGPPVGSEFAGYRLDEVIGRGGMGVVYSAHQIQLDRRVALKFLSPELAGNDRLRARFIRESRLAAAIEHPNIVPIYEAGERDGVLFIAMRYIDGPDLGTLIKQQGPLAPGRALGILRQVAAALDAAHRRGLVHRDIKPANILVALDGGDGGGERAYLADFGITRRTLADTATTTADTSLTEVGGFLGTPDYVAPEQVAGVAIDGRVDQYALGGVLFECLTQRKPYERPNAAALIYAHVAEPPPRATEVRPELPAAVDGVIARAMAKSAEDRYPDCASMVRDGDAAFGPAATVESGRTAALATGPPRSGGDSVLPLAAPARPPLMRRRVPLLTGAAVVAVAAGAVGWTATHRGGQSGSTGSGGSSSGLAPVTGYTVSEVMVPNGATPAGITEGPDGALWFTEMDGNKIGRQGGGKLAEFLIPTPGAQPVRITAGPDGNLWFTEFKTAKVGRITPEGKITEFAVTSAGADPYGITAGPDGNVWFTERDAGRIGRITPAGAITEFPVAADDPGLVGIVAGRDDNLWFTEFHHDKIARMTTGGMVSEFVLSAGSNPFGIAVGADDNLWFTENGRNQIGRASTDGRVTEFSIPTASSGPQDITAGGPTAAMWFTEHDVGAVARIGPDGVVTELAIPTSGSNPDGIASAAGGDLWFAETTPDLLGHITPATGTPRPT